MAETKESTTGKGNTAVEGDHDRVAMLSLKADGTPDQTKPEVILDEKSATEASEAQFVQQAVSAKDVEIRSSWRGSATYEDVDDKGKPIEAPEDPTVEELKKEVEKVADSAKKAAGSAVKAALPKEKK